MRARSSIFSFDTLSVEVRLPTALAWCVAFLVVFRLLINCLGGDPTSRGDISNASEHLRSARGKDLRVVFFGSSRLQSAILSEEWARRAGLRPDQVLNLAVQSGRLWDVLFMVDRAGGIPPSVELAVIEISPWEFNRNVMNPVTKMRETIPEHLRTWATLSDRLAVDGIGSRMRLLADWFWPVYRRIPVQKWEISRSPSKLEPLLGPLHHFDDERRRSLANSGAFRGKEMAAFHFSHPSFSGFAQRNLERIITTLGHGPFRLVLLQLPARRAYIGAIKSDPDRSALYERIRDVVRASTSEHVEFIDWEISDDCGLGEDVFVDYGHFTREGAVAFTNRLFPELEAR